VTDDLLRLDALGQAEAVRRGEVSPAELVDASIARIEKLNPQLNAVITPLFEKARRQAERGPLGTGAFRGVPFLLKDLTAESEGDPHFAGVRAAKKHGYVSTADTWLARRFRDAGFVFLGKTNTPEFGSQPTTEPLAFGPSRNPWDPSRGTGGSSGGSAAAVAAGMVAAAHANDGGGSIRIPASACGLVGLKPSRGRVSLGPTWGDQWAGCVAELAVTRSVRDTAAILDAVSGPEPGDPYVAPPPARPFLAEVGAAPGRLRIAFVTRPLIDGVEIHPECARAAEQAARRLAGLGHHVEEARVEPLRDETVASAFTSVVAVWTQNDVADWSERLGRRLGPGDVEPGNLDFAEMGEQVSGLGYMRAVAALQRFSRRVALHWRDEGWDLLLTPTLAEPPPPLGDFVPTEDDPRRPMRRSMAFVAFTCPFNVTGQPAISLPLAWSEAGLPIGVQLAAPYAREDLLLRVAAQLEEDVPWRDRWPQL
jgi:amidase